MVLGELIYERMNRVIGQRVLSVKEEERPFFGPPNNTSRILG